MQIYFIVFSVIDWLDLTVLRYDLSDKSYFIFISIKSHK